jgi:hypothetical protein
VMRWGLIPFWAKDIKIGFSTINAEAEEIMTKPAFRGAFVAAMRPQVIGYVGRQRTGNVLCHYRSGSILRGGRERSSWNSTSASTNCWARPRALSY